MKKSMVRWISLLLVLCLGLSAALTGCGGKEPDSDKDSQTGPASEAGSKRDTLNYGLNQEPAKLDPQNDSLLVTSLVNKQIYDTLLRRDDETGEIVPHLATEWEWVDDTTLHMTLRDDV